MDPVLPFRALSPGTRKPKVIHQRNRDTKLSLKKTPNADSRKENKENKPPTISRGHTLTKPIFKLDDSDLMTSDESDSSTNDKGSDGNRNSIMSFNTQESVFSLPVAESTRCELAAQKSAGHVESAFTSLHTAQNETSSSANSLYFTAYPYPLGCNESIVCISDSSPESLKMTVKKKTKPSESVLITSDESDCESIGKYPRSKIQFQVKKSVEKKLYDTVILDSSASDNDDEKHPECDVIIPPSIASHRSSCDSSISSTNSDTEGVHDNCGVVIPPSPEMFSDKSLISEDSCRKESFVKIQKTSKRLNGSDANPACKQQICDRQGHNKSTEKQESPAEPELNESSWKEDFRLVMPESSSCSEEQMTSTNHQSKTHPPKDKPYNQTARAISKEKFNDIARWLFSGRESCGSSSDDVPACTTKPDRVKQAAPIEESKSVKHPQVKRLSIVRRSSFGSESDDNFNALMDSIRKKREDTSKKFCAKNDRKGNDDSFINDSCTSDFVESPSFNIYHSDITRSIKAEVKSVKRSVRSIRKRQVFRHVFDSSEESDETGEITEPTEHRKTNLKSVRKVYKPVHTDESDSESDYVKKSVKVTNGNNSDKEKNRLPDTLTTSVGERKVISKVISKTNVNETSQTSSSDAEEPVKSRIRGWRENAYSSENSDSSNSKSSLEIPKVPPKLNQEKDQSKKILEKPIRKALPAVTPKKIASLKSPQTPYSPIRTFLSSLSGPTHQPGVRDHPEAAIYNKSFKSKKEELTRRLFKLFNREVFDKRLPDDLVLEWNARLVRTAGLCYCKLLRKGGVTSRTAKIALSTKVITSADRLRDTLIHEMCHAAVWLLNNVSGGHGPFWKAWAQKAMKRFPELPSIERCHSYDIETKYTYKCTKCGYSFGRHSKSLDLIKKRCGYCYGTFEVFLSTKGQSSKENTLKTPKAPSAFALFVKENYGLLKQENGNLKHGDIMKKLGEKFACMKVKQSDS